jgi:hypothetical protein
MRAWVAERPQFNGREARPLRDFLTTDFRSGIT